MKHSDAASSTCEPARARRSQRKAEPGAALAVYRELVKRFERIDRRTTNYQFDLDADIRWDSLAAPGAHFSSSLLKAFGLETISSHAEAHDVFQWAIALSMCGTFMKGEQLLCRFVEAYRKELGPTRSTELLDDEEQKHIELFRRYADHLKGQHPEWLAAFAGAFRPSIDYFENAGQQLLGAGSLSFPTTAVLHYTFWLEILFFEEYTVYLQDRLLEGGATVQPAWLSVHAAHRREEVQHLVTNAEHVEALAMTDAQRAEWGKLFAVGLPRHYPFITGVDAAVRMIDAMFPELAPVFPASQLSNNAFFDDVLHARAFKRTRGCAPYFDELAALKTKAPA